MNCDIQAVFFDFGGVIAEEGFHDGFREIGKMNGLDPEWIFRTADRIISETGYLTGNADETIFWNTFRRQTGIASPDSALREEILKRFVLRPVMVAVVDRIRARGMIVALLSDQTNWLEELDRTTSLFIHFDRVFNSFQTGKSKRDPSAFTDACASLDIAPARTLFVDDNREHIERALGRGLPVIHFTSIAEFQKRISEMLRFEV